MSRCGTKSVHCCWLGEAGKCRFVSKSTVEGFKHKCDLRAEHGSWEAAEASPEYQEHIQPFWDKYPVPNMSCSKWPGPGIRCNDCGEVGK